jgi:hypothetical protein
MKYLAQFLANPPAEIPKTAGAGTDKTDKTPRMWKRWGTPNISNAGVAGTDKTDRTPLVHESDGVLSVLSASRGAALESFRAGDDTPDNPGYPGAVNLLSRTTQAGLVLYVEGDELRVYARPTSRPTAALLAELDRRSAELVELIHDDPRPDLDDGLRPIGIVIDRPDRARVLVAVAAIQSDRGDAYEGDQPDDLPRHRKT